MQVEDGQANASDDVTARKWNMLACELLCLLFLQRDQKKTQSYELVLKKK